MKNLAYRRQAWQAGLIALAMAWSVSEAATPDRPMQQGAQPAASASPQGVYWSWTTERRRVMGAMGGSFEIPIFKFQFIAFQDKGWAYVGVPSINTADMRCSGPRAVDGQAVCVPFSRQGQRLKLGDDTLPISAVNGGWQIGEQTWRPMPAFSGLKLSGTYQSYDCAAATCSHASITFTRDGRYRFSESSTFVLDLGDVFRNGGDGRGAHGGHYAIVGTRIDFTPDGATPRSAFFFRQPDGKPDTIQLGDTLFSTEEH